MRRVSQRVGAAATAMLLLSAGAPPPSQAQVDQPALAVRRLDTTQFPVVEVAVTVSAKVEAAGAAPPAFRVIQEADDRRLDVQPCADVLAAAIVVDNRVGPDPGALRALRNAAAEFALRLAGDPEVSVFGTAGPPPPPGPGADHPVGAIAALGPGTDGDPATALEGALRELSAKPHAYPVVLWLGTGGDEVGDAVDVVRGTGTPLYALTLGPPEAAPFEDEVSATGGWSVSGSADELRQAARDVVGDLSRTYLLTFTAREDVAEGTITVVGPAVTDSRGEVTLVIEGPPGPRPASRPDPWLVVLAAVLVVLDVVALLKRRDGPPVLGEAGATNAAG